jgi:hypothetical protein
MPHECKCYVPIWTRFIDFLLEGTKIMADGQSALDAIVSVKGILESVDVKLDDVRGNVTSLKAEVQALKDQLAAGSPITQEQLDAVVAGLGEIETKAAALLAESEEAAV